MGMVLLWTLVGLVGWFVVACVSGVVLGRGVSLGEARDLQPVPVPVRVPPTS